MGTKTIGGGTPLARNVSPFRVGLFILVCSALGLAGTIWLGASHWFEKNRIYAAYFDESVRGLQEDAVINYRGVAVGRVKSIGLAPDGKLIQVVMALRADYQIGGGVAVQLRDQGLTGLRYLEIDTAPENIDKLTPTIEFKPHYPVIPSYPSEIQQLKSALQSIYDRMNALDLKSLTDNWTQTAVLINDVLAKIQTAFNPADWSKTSLAVRKTAEGAATFMEHFSRASSSGGGMDKGFKDLYATLESSRRATEALSKQLASLPPNTVSGIAKNVDSAVVSGGAAFKTLDHELLDSATILDQSLQQFKTLLIQLNGLIQTLKERPNQILFQSKEPDPFKRNKK